MPQPRLGWVAGWQLCAKTPKCYIKPAICLRNLWPFVWLGVFLQVVYRRPCCRTWVPPLDQEKYNAPFDCRDPKASPNPPAKSLHFGARPTQVQSHVMMVCVSYGLFLNNTHSEVVFSLIRRHCQHMTREPQTCLKWRMLQVGQSLTRLAKKWALVRNTWYIGRLTNFFPCGNLAMTANVEHRVARNCGAAPTRSSFSKDILLQFHNHVIPYRTRSWASSSCKSAAFISPSVCMCIWGGKMCLKRLWMSTSFWLRS